MSAVRIAIVGSGPAGMYAAQHLLTRRDPAIGVDLFERLPTPWGLVRAGVAPDHPEKKRVADRLFRQLFARPELRYFGNVEIGRDLEIEELRQRYSAVILASGASGDVALDIPGANLPGAFSARQFVAWYNGHPDFRDLDFDLGQRRVAVIGNGNVALDVARILTLSPARLAQSDIAPHALEALRHSQVEEVVITGRRGAAQVAFNPPELEELLHLPDVDVIVEGDDSLADRGFDPAALPWLQARRLTILRELYRRPLTGAPRRIRLVFFAAPAALRGEARVEALELRRTRFDEKDALVTTDEVVTVASGLVLSAIGYRGKAFPGLPFDAARAIIPHRDGRILDGDQPARGLYLTGWIKRGPRGIIGSNKKCAALTVESLLQDLASGVLQPADGGDIDALLAQRGVRVVDGATWSRIDRAEQLAGRACGRPRLKFTEVEAMLEAGMSS
jgi:ferredoxin--NADP+ reductase